jgi:hypothetical protein
MDGIGKGAAGICPSAAAVARAIGPGGGGGGVRRPEGAGGRAPVDGGLRAESIHLSPCRDSARVGG